MKKKKRNPRKTERGAFRIVLERKCPWGGCKLTEILNSLAFEVSSLRRLRFPIKTAVSPRLHIHIQGHLKVSFWACDFVCFPRITEEDRRKQCWVFEFCICFSITFVEDFIFSGPHDDFSHFHWSISCDLCQILKCFLWRLFLFRFFG